MSGCSSPSRVEALKNASEPVEKARLLSCLHDQQQNVALLLLCKDIREGVEIGLVYDVRAAGDFLHETATRQRPTIVMRPAVCGLWQQTLTLSSASPGKG